jgi:hypothetical protein
MNAAARGWSARRGIKRDHITPLREGPAWRKAVDRIEFKLDNLVFRCLNGVVSWYLACELQHVGNIESRQRLRSAAHEVRLTRRSTLGDRTFTVAAAWAWNRLPTNVATSLPSTAFK